MALEDPVDPGATADAEYATDFPSVQGFEDGSTLQTFEDGSTLATATDGTTSTTDAPTEPTTATEPSVNSPPPNGPAYDDDGNIMPGYSLDENNDPVWVGGDFVEPATQASADASRAEAASGSSLLGGIGSAIGGLGAAASRLLGGGLSFGAGANTPAAAIASFGPAKDLRAKLRVPSSYLVGPAAGPAGILAQNSGILFPYTPQITSEQKAEYGTSAPLHSNYNFSFFKNGAVGPISITAKFTVQTEYDGAVLLGVIHLLRALTKMKWGTEPDAGSPPPVCRLDAYGDYMYNNVPVAITSWRHDLPDNVDYITVGRKGSSRTYGTSMVPTISTIQLTLNVMYSRQEMLNHNVKDWLAGKLANKGYL